jgi:predicted nuclease with TOPRIM domain
LSKKYARLSEQAAELKQNNQDLTAENSKLKEQVVSLDARLQQAQKELNEANVLLREMLVELNNWKMNVIGFRDEMRDAEKAQLEALLRILEVLGGQVTMESVGGGQEASVQGAGPSGNEIAGLSSVAAPGPVGPQLPEGAGAGEHDE